MNPLHHSNQDARTQIPRGKQIENVVRRSFYQVVLVRLRQLSEGVPTRRIAQEECQSCASCQKAGQRELHEMGQHWRMLLKRISKVVFSLKQIPPFGLDDGG